VGPFRNIICFARFLIYRFLFLLGVEGIRTYMLEIDKACFYGLLGISYHSVLQ